MFQSHYLEPLEFTWPLRPFLPGARPAHINCESATYILKGHGRFITGPRLEQELVIGPGDFTYVPAKALQQPVNDSDSPMELIVARNTPVEVIEEYRP